LGRLAGGAGESPYVQIRARSSMAEAVRCIASGRFPTPLLATFDAPSREICQSSVHGTNTPRPALELLNDVTYVGRAITGTARAEQGDPVQSDHVLFSSALARTPNPARLGPCWRRGLEAIAKDYEANKEAGGSIYQAR